MKPQPGKFILSSSHCTAISSGVIVKNSTRSEEYATSVRLVFLERHGVELKPVINQFIAELARDFGLQALDLLRLEFHHVAVTQIDQMVVVRLGCRS